MKATIGNLNGYLSTTLPGYELVKGQGYFYFQCSGTSNIEPPESIYVYTLGEMTYEQWCTSIDAAVEDWKAENN